MENQKQKEPDGKTTESSSFANRPGLTDSSRPSGIAGPPQIDGFDILEEIGRGGIGVVYRAHDKRLDRWVAIKTLLLSQPSPDELAFIQREAQLAAKLHHPNIVSVHDFYPHTQPPCFIMEWVDGTSLDRAAEWMDYKQKAALLSKIARAVAYAHDLGVVHRDLKPGNIMVDRAGEPRVLDFGLARRSGAGEVASTSIKGTPLYMAPEQVLSPETVGPRADIYALGLVLYQLLTGTKPPEPTTRSDLKAWADRILPLPREINPDIPEPLQRICLTACEQDPSDRYPTARHLADDLDRFIADQPIAARPKRYVRLLEERVQAHVEDLTLWEEEGLITSQERDSMGNRYSKMARLDSLWVPGARWLRLGPAICQLGGWLIVVSALLWPLFYWSDLTKWQRVAAVGLPTFVVNLAGILMWRRQQRLLGTIFCAVGAVLLPIFFGVLFSQFDLFEWRQRDDFELFPPQFPCNVQLFLSAFIMLAYSSALVGKTRLGLFAVLTTVSALLAYASLLLLLGLKKELLDEHYAFLACWWWPVVVSLYVVASRLDKKKLEHFAGPPYVATAALFIAIVSILALDVPKSWWGIQNINEKQVAICILFIGSSFLYAIVARLHDRSWSRMRRIWGVFFYWLVPPFCVIPLHLLEFPLKNLNWRFLLVPFTQVYCTEVLVFLACLVFIWLAVYVQLRLYLYYGLIHLAVKLIYFTNEHLSDYLSWPLAVLVIGILTMFLGMEIEFRMANGREKQSGSG